MVIQIAFTESAMGSAAAVCNNNIYVFGGCPNTKAVELYDLADGCRSTLRALPLGNSDRKA